jgi:hypothetical protein
VGVVHWGMMVRIDTFVAVVFVVVVARLQRV